MKFRKSKPTSEHPSPVQTAPRQALAMGLLGHYYPETADTRLYTAVRNQVPIISAAIDKIIRLVGNFTVTCPTDQALEQELAEFLKSVPCGASSQGIENFVLAYLDCLLTKGTAVGEVVLQADGSGIGGLYNAVLSDVCLKRGDNPFDVQVCRNDVGVSTPVPYPQLVLYSALKPDAGMVTGNSLLKGLPKLADILMKIYDCIGSNFERMGNLRYAVTYRNADGADRVSAKQRADAIAKEWSHAMQPGAVRDFVAVGDVDIKVIGADAQMISTDIPVRQLLEQIVAKTGIPPFMLGLQWSTTERMSTQQADILTSELEYYRRLLEPIILKICNLWQRFQGRSERFVVQWSNINLQDEVELARARLYQAQADQLCIGKECDS